MEAVAQTSGGPAGARLRLSEKPGHAVRATPLFVDHPALGLSVAFPASSPLSEHP
jgi:hypothetical protein